MTAKADAFQKIRELVQKFLHNRERYEAPDFNEASTRQEFINPLFEALGWDIGNKKGHSPNYQEVVLEANVKTAEGKKRSDYIFRIGEKPVFIVEGKKLSVSLGKGHEAGKVSYQIRNYAWNASLAVSLVTNFKEIVVYDCRNKPKENDKNTAIQHIKIENFFQEQGLLGDEFHVDFDFLWETFGRDNVWKGNLEKYIQNDTGKFGILSVDDDFLNMLETWRRKLAADIFRNNKNMTEQELNVSVQQIIDRIVFLRLAEDRNIEHGRSLAEAAATYEKFACCRNLFDRFSQADEKYNSGLFRSGNGTVSHNLLIGNHVLKEIIQNLYHYYDFSLIPIEILGSAYERFLGSEIKIVSGTVRTELKPEVRKQGGVFYTPQYIVDYIVKNTVGKLLEGKNAKEAAKITVLDPACGSGSFLVGAYSFLLRWYQNYYLAAKVSRGRKNDPLTPDGLLTIEER
ncbi:MAG: N-6 DNA methylase, partial [Planctomycetaceae bacterium]|nr:N-6 DNA methylase [Planctomycetaceae bacterium]